MARMAVDNVEPDPISEVKEETLTEQAQQVTPTPTSEEKKQHKSSGKKEWQVTESVRQKAGKSVFSAFLVKPSKIAFQNAEVDEQIVLLLRAHPVTMVPWWIGVFFLLILPFVVLPVLQFAGAVPVTPGALLVLTLLWFAGVFTFAFVKFLYWYFNVYIVTDEQVVDIDWFNIVNKEVSATELEKIQDVTSRQGGVVAGIFDYGDVIIQTAGKESNFEFTAVPHPQEVAEEIADLMDQIGLGKIAVDSIGGGIR